MSLNIEISKTTTPKTRPAPDTELGFGRVFTDHMFRMDWEAGKGWFEPAIQPYGPLGIDPAAGAFHYGQAMFEGLKCFRRTDGSLAMFRPEKHAQRMATGAPRLCMPVLPPEDMLQAAMALVKIDADWVPAKEGTALYLRPTMVASEAFLGVRPANKYVFFIIASAVGSYYGGKGLKPVRIFVEVQQVRACRGGLGGVKAGANYVASLNAAQRAKKEGYDQVLWLDGQTHELLEEVGTMNLFAVVGDSLVTPPLSDSILPGVTRDSVLALAKDLGLKAEERPISMKELKVASQRGTLKEVFGTGTAAVISPVGELALTDEKLVINNGEVGPIATKLYEEITGIQRGTKPDTHGWMVPVV